MSRVIKPFEICAQIEVDGVLIENATPEIIHIHKNNPSLLIRAADNNNIIKNYNYEQFRTLAIVRKSFLALDHLESGSLEEVSLSNVVTRRSSKRRVDKSLISPLIPSEGAVEFPQDQLSRPSRNSLSETDGTASLKMEFSLKVATSVIKEFDGARAESAQDWVDATCFYSDQLTQEGKDKLVKYIYQVSLKRRAKEAFRSQEPRSVEEICNVILKRFKPLETLTSVQRMIAECYQGNRSVNTYVSELEELGNKYTSIQIAELGIGSKEHIRRSCEQLLISTLRQGLYGEGRIAVLAGKPSTFEEAVSIARNAEVIQRDVVDHQFANSSFRGNNYNGFGNRGSNRGRYNRDFRNKNRGRGVYRPYNNRGGYVQRGRGAYYVQEPRERRFMNAIAHSEWNQEPVVNNNSQIQDVSEFFRR